MSLKPVLPTYLKKGDNVRVVAPCSPFEEHLFQQGLRLLENFGLRVIWEKGIMSRDEYLAGSDQRRFTELQNAFSDKSTKAVFVARGGYGSMRLWLHGKGLKFARPVIFMGMSDVTNVLNWIPKKFGFSTVHGPVLAGSLLHTLPTTQQEKLFKGLFEPEEILVKNEASYSIIRKGSAKGILAGGNLAVLETALATSLDVDFKNKILFLEDIHEPPYKIDRMLTHLALAGKLKHIRGLILGDFTDGKEKFLEKEFLSRVVLDLIPKGIPVLHGLKVGHHFCEYLLPIGQVVEIRKGGKELMIPPCVGNRRA